MPTPTTCPGARMTQTTIVMRLAINVPIGKRTVRVSLACIRDKDCESTATSIADSRDGAVEANGQVDEAPGVERQGALYPLLNAKQHKAERWSGHGPTSARRVGVFSWRADRGSFSGGDVVGAA